MSAMERFEIAPADSIAPGSMAAFDAGGRRVLVCNVAGEFHSVDELCPHLAIPLGQGRIDGTQVTCPGHGSVFDVVSGECVRWIGRKPGLFAKVLSSAPSSPVKHPTQVIDGIVHVDLP